jgi:hypothetical protein
VIRAPKGPPVIEIPFASWVANAAVGLTGLHGDVTRQAKVADCSRQTIDDHAHKVQAAVVDPHDGGPARATLIAQIHRLRLGDAQLWDWLAQAIEFPDDKEHESSVTAAAMGLSLNQVLVLLALIPGRLACPGRSTPHRRVKRHSEGVIARGVRPTRPGAIRGEIPPLRPFDVARPGRAEVGEGYDFFERLATVPARGAWRRGTALYAATLLRRAPARRRDEPRAVRPSHRDGPRGRDRHSTAAAVVRSSLS